MKVPKPTSATVSPFLRAFFTTSINASTAFAPSTLVRLAASDTALINSALFIYLSRRNFLDRNVICFFANVSFRGGSNSSRYPVIAWTCVVTWIAAQTLYQWLGLHAIQVLARF